MEMCAAHWADLRKALDDRGLTPLIAADTDAAAVNLQASIDGEYDPVKHWDPLMASTLAIYARGLECGGLYLMTGDYCPLCELAKHGSAEQPAKWIDGCTDAMQAHARSLGLIATN
jgi:hypothetical protein